MLELIKKNYWWPGLKEDVKNVYKVVSNANKTKSSIKGNWESYTHWKYLKDHGKKLA